MYVCTCIYSFTLILVKISAKIRYKQSESAHLHIEPETIMRMMWVAASHCTFF